MPFHINADIFRSICNTVVEFGIKCFSLQDDLFGHQCHAKTLFDSLNICLQLSLQVWSIFSFYKTGFYDTKRKLLL